MLSVLSSYSFFRLTYFVLCNINIWSTKYIRFLHYTDVMYTLSISLCAGSQCSCICVKWKQRSPGSWCTNWFLNTSISAYCVGYTGKIFNWWKWDTYPVSVFGRSFCCIPQGIPCHVSFLVIWLSYWRHIWAIGLAIAIRCRSSG